MQATSDLVAFWNKACRMFLRSSVHPYIKSSRMPQHPSQCAAHASLARVFVSPTSHMHAGSATHCTKTLLIRRVQGSARFQEPS